MEASPASSAPDPRFLEQLMRAPAGEGRRLLADFVHAELAAFLGYGGPEEVGPRDSFMDLGFDSLRAVDFKLLLESKLLLSLRTTLLFDYPTPEALVRYLADEELALPAPERAATGVEPLLRRAPGEAGETDQPGEQDLERLSPTELRILFERQAARLRALERGLGEPIAVVGLGCRFPGGADGPAAFWSMLDEGRDAIVEVPPERWPIDTYYDPDPAAAGKMYCRRGGFLRGPIDGFDARFFSISPREAVELDPQQRLLLEVAWETLEHAGVAPAGLFGSPTGVFIGLRESEYFNSQSGRGAHEVGSYYGTGNALSTAAGRISFTLGLTGPCVSLDTACSSSSVAVHLACQSLRLGECRAALAGGVSLILDPLSNVGLSRATMLAADGRCKTFDAAADGYGRSEGCGLVLLKRLSAARADGDRVLALIRGTAVNQDGASGGLTVPNGPAQQAVLRGALANAGLAPYQVGYVEAHGTGTALGDPIEVGALDAVFGANRPHGQPLVVGSVKTNIGHLETAAGVAGLIKVVLALEHGRIPPHLNLESPNPHIPWEESVVQLPTGGMEWPSGGPERVAGVSSFGFSGTNAHLVVSEAPAAEPVPAAPALERPAELLSLSAASEDALAELAERYRAALAEPDGALAAADLGDLACTAGAGRSHFAHRAALVAGGRDELAAALADLAEGRGTPARAPSRPPGLAFVFTGQGSQYAGMGRGLYRAQPVFRAALERCAEGLAPLLEEPLLEVLWGARTELLDRTGYTQPALFALEYALAELWTSFGLRPDWVLGHSVGEYAAACLAGVFEPEDALRLIAARGRLMEERCETGAMLAVTATEEALAERVAACGGAVAVAAVNAPEQVVLSGAAPAVDELAAALTAEGVEVRRLTVSHAFHSPLMEPMLAPFEEIARGIEYRAPSLGFVSCLEPGPVTERMACADYWVRHVREPVRFLEGLRALDARGPELFVELGPAPVLIAQAGRGLARDRARTLLPSLRRGREELRQVLESLGRLYLAGAPVDWAGVHRGCGRRRLSLPTYPFQRARHWLERPAANGAVPALPSGAHPLLGRRVHSSLLERGEALFESFLGERSPSFLGEHRVFGRAVAPGAAYLELALAAGRSVLGQGALELRGSAFQDPLLLAPEPAPLQVTLRPPAGDGGGHAFEVLTAAGGGTSDGPPPAWRRHAAGRVQRAPEGTGDGGPAADLGELRERFAGGEREVEAFYAAFARVGLEYGPSFRAVRRLWQRESESLAELELPEGSAAGAGPERFELHPALLDACFQSTGAILDARGSEETFLPVGADRVLLRSSGAARVWCHARLRDPGDGPLRVLALDLALFGAGGEPLGAVEGLRLMRASRGALLGGGDELLYGVAWRPRPRAAAAATDDGKPAADPAAAGRWLILGEGNGLGAALARELEAGGASVELEPGGEPAPERLAPELRGVVHLLALDAGGDQRLQCGSVLGLVQSLAGRPRPPRPPRLVLATRGSQAAEEGHRPLAYGQATLWGLGATLALEHPEHELLRVDLDPAFHARPGTPEALAAEARLLAAELLAPDGETQLAFRRGERRAARLEPLAARRPVRLERPAAGPYALRIAAPGTLEGLRLVPAERRPPGPGEVELEVRAASINLKDVLLALGMLQAPDDSGNGGPPLGPPLGMECAARVSATGEGVEHVRPGDAVLAAPVGALASHVVAPAYTVARVPEGLSDVEVAGLQTAFLTGLHGLVHLAGLAPGERVLIHAAAGGVGQAAVQLAQRAGAEVYATASRGKRDLLRAQGVRAVFDSRSTDFADEVLAATGGRGVDVVLNSLTGEFIPAGLRCLAPGGRFLEIGKIGIWDAEQVAAERPDVRYFAYDMSELRVREPARYRALLEELCAGLSGGGLRPLPTAVFPIEDAVRAFGYLAQAKNVGKVVLELPPAGAPDGTDRGEPGRLPARADGTYVISGGLGALGLAAAARLVEDGARSLLLLSRREPDGRARAAIEALEARGAAVRTAAVDVADRGALAEVLAAARRELPPLVGVLHAAGVLDDGVLLRLDWERFERVLAPKLQGAVNLHELTAGDPLELFVLYSSMVSMVGSLGQASYAAGNAALDALAHHRRGLGLPATSVNWGPWSEAGMAAERADENRARFDAMGLSSIDPEEGHALLARILRGREDQVGVLPIEWSRFLAQLRGSGAPPFFDEVAAASRVAGARGAGDAAAGPDLAEALDQAPPGERRARLLALLQEELARVLGFGSGAEIDPEQPFLELGVDSLLAVDLRNRLEAGLAVSLSATLLFDHPTPAALADHLLAELDGRAASGATGAEGAGELDEDEAELLAELEALSEEEVERQLALGEELE